MTLTQAIQKNDIDAVRELLAQNADPNAEDKDGNRPLGIAARKGFNDIALLLLDSGADIHALHWGNQHNIFFYANAELIPILKARGGNPNQSCHQHSPVAFALRSDDRSTLIGRIQALLEAEADVNAPGVVSALIYGALGKPTPVEVIKLLLQTGLKLDQESLGTGEGGVVESVLRGPTPEKVNLFIKAGAPLNRNGILQALVRLPYEKYWRLAEQALKKGLAIDSARFSNRTALHVAAGDGSLPWVAWLLQHGASVNVLDSKDESPLGCAIREGSLECVSKLLEAGANPNLGKLDDFTMLDWCKAWPKQSKMQALLAEAGAVGEEPEANYSKEEQLWRDFQAAETPLEQVKACLKFLDCCGVPVSETVRNELAKKAGALRRIKAFFGDRVDMDAPLETSSVLEIIIPERCCSAAYEALNGATKEECLSFYPELIQELAKAGDWNIQNLTRFAEDDGVTVQFDAFGEAQGLHLSFHGGNLDLFLFDYLDLFREIYPSTRPYFRFDQDDISTIVFANDKAIEVWQSLQ